MTSRRTTLVSFYASLLLGGCAAQSPRASAPSKETVSSEDPPSNRDEPEEPEVERKRADDYPGMW